MSLPEPETCVSLASRATVCVCECEKEIRKKRGRVYITQLHVLFFHSSVLC